MVPISQRNQPMTQAELDLIVNTVLPVTAAVKIEINKPGLREHVERTNSPPRKKAVLNKEVAFGQHSNGVSN